MNGRSMLVMGHHPPGGPSILTMTCVLLAEDDASISEPLARALRREGYDVDVSADGPGTLEAALAGGIDLIVLDIGLPRLDGLEVCRLALRRADRAGPDPHRPRG